MKTRSGKRLLITVFAVAACAAALLFILLFLAPRLIGHAGDERTATIRIVSIEDDWATAEVIRDDAPFFARLPHEIVFDTKCWAPWRRVWNRAGVFRRCICPGPPAASR